MSGGAHLEVPSSLDYFATLVAEDQGFPLLEAAIAVGQARDPDLDPQAVMVALDRTTRENGCLQVLRGSHHAGRVDHGVLPGEQVGAEPRRVQEMLERLERVYVEMEPGDGLFFHSNVMHRSDQNRSPDRRWTVLFCYNAARNDPYLDHHHPRYTPLSKVDDGAVRAAGLRFAEADDNFFRKTFANPPELGKRYEQAAAMDHGPRDGAGLAAPDRSD